MTTKAKILEILAEGEKAEEELNNLPPHLDIELFSFSAQFATMKYLSVIAHSLFEED